MLVSHWLAEDAVSHLYRVPSKGLASSGSSARGSCHLINTNVNNNNNTVIIIHFISSIYHYLQVVKEANVIIPTYQIRRWRFMNLSDLPKLQGGPRKDSDAGPRVASSTRKKTPGSLCISFSSVGASLPHLLCCLLNISPLKWLTFLKNSFLKEIYMTTIKVK